MAGCKWAVLSVYISLALIWLLKTEKGCSPFLFFSPDLDGPGGLFYICMSIQHHRASNQVRLKKKITDVPDWNDGIKGALGN